MPNSGRVERLVIEAAAYDYCAQTGPRDEYAFHRAAAFETRRRARELQRKL